MYKTTIVIVICVLLMAVAIIVKIIIYKVQPSVGIESVTQDSPDNKLYALVTTYKGKSFWGKEEYWSKCQVLESSTNNQLYIYTSSPGSDKFNWKRYGTLSWESHSKVIFRHHTDLPGYTNNFECRFP